MDENVDYEALEKAINHLTIELSSLLVKEFASLPIPLQINLVLIKSAQMLLANILCHIAETNDELEILSQNQGTEINDIVFDYLM